MGNNEITIVIAMENEEDTATSLNYDIPENVNNNIIRIAFADINSLRRKITNIKLAKVEREGKDVTKYFSLEQNGFAFLLSFDKKMIRKTVEDDGIQFNVTLREKL